MSREGLVTSLSSGESAIIIARRIHQICPEARIVIGIRNQIDFIKSFYCQVIVQGGALSFKDFYSSYPTKKLIKDLRYEKIIYEYYQLYGKDKVFVYSLNNLKKDSNAMIKDMSSFLSVKFVEDCLPHAKVNRSLSKYGLFCTLLLNRLLQNILLFNLPKAESLSYRYHGSDRYYYKGIKTGLGVTLNEKIFNRLRIKYRPIISNLDRKLNLNNKYNISKKYEDKLNKLFLNLIS